MTNPDAMQTGAYELGSEPPKKPRGWYSAAAKQQRQALRARKREERKLVSRLREARKGRIAAKKDALVRLADHTIPHLKVQQAMQAHADIRKAETDKRAADQAAKFRRDAKELGRRTFMVATPERQAKAGEPLNTLKTTEGARRIETQELSDWPLERLYRAGAFRGRSGDAETDKRIAYLRNEAGQQLYAHWYHGRLFPLGSRDYRKPYSGGSDNFAIMPQTERQVFHRNRWREADACLGSDRTARVTRAIVLDEKEPVAVGRIITGRNDAAQARAIAIEMLIDGLDRLRVLWKMNT
jgi:hypothetical protein